MPVDPWAAEPDEAAPATSEGSPGVGDGLETLREILLPRYRQRIEELEAEVEALRRQVADQEALVALLKPVISEVLEARIAEARDEMAEALAPVMGEALRRQIRNARDDIIEALHPIIGSTVTRAVSEALRNLARLIDERMRRAFGFGAFLRRLRARLSGVSEAELILREALPFTIREIFLIHQASGLLLARISQPGVMEKDSDLISAMLTAIKDFARDAFGRGVEGELAEIEYGDRRILLEFGRQAYLAAVVDGVEPMGFRQVMRDALAAVHDAHGAALSQYARDGTKIEGIDRPLYPLLMGSLAGREPARPEARFPTLGIAVLVAAVLLFCGALAMGVRAWGTWVMAPTTPTATLTPSVTPSPSHTPSPTPPATPTVTASPTTTSLPTPTATTSPVPTATPMPVIGLMLGNVFVRDGPSMDARRTGVVLLQGQQVVAEMAGEWCRVRYPPGPDFTVMGWVPRRWVGTLGPVPETIASPGP